MAQSSNVSAGQDATALSYNNLRADVFGAHHSDALGTLLVNADISPTAAIALSKLAALTINRALVTNESGVIVVSAVTATELGYLAGIVSKPVCNSGDETIAGVKTFSSIPVLPASDPTTDNQASRKAYVNTQVSAYRRLDYVEIEYPGWSSPTADSVWEDWDLSASIPSGGLYAEILVKMTATGPNNIGVRANGSAVTRYITMYNYDTFTFTVKLDAGRIVERYSGGAAANAKFTVIGYWKQV